MTSRDWRSDIGLAAEVLGRRVRRTPVIEQDGVTYKLELLQHTGSFKPRGALYRALTEPIPEAGLIAASGGNHGLAVAWVARQLGVHAEIFVPEVSPQTKVDGLRDLGATVHVTGALYDDALASCRARQAETGALDIHAYDHPSTIVGAGTIGREIEQQVPDVDTVLVAVGGGGLASGIAAWFTGTGVSVVTAEPTQSRCWAAASMAGRPVDVTVDSLAADSLGARRVGAANFEVLAAAAAVPTLVDDVEIAAAQRRLWREFHLIAEPGGATAAAALWSESARAMSGKALGSQIVVVVCGANTDPAAVVRRNP